MPPRVDAPELLDLGLGTPEQVQASLADLWRINRYLGGIWSLMRHLIPRLRAHTGPVTVLDIGAGAAQVAAAVAAWGQRHQRDVRVYALDIALKHLQLGPVAPPPNLSIIQGDAFAPPVQPVDYVISSLFLHHFPPDTLVRLLKTVAARARHALIMADLVRGRLPQVAWHLMTPVLARSPITRHDGLVSIRRAYTPGEMRRFARAAGLHRASVYEEFPWRQILVADTHA